jgi:hypothetical protein
MLVESTKNCRGPTKEDSNSMIGALRWLKQESNRQAGKHLVTERLRDRMYADMRATRYFSECYDLRSSLVHGGTHWLGATRAMRTRCSLANVIAEGRNGVASSRSKAGA